MRVDVYVPLVLAALLAVAGPGVGRVLAPPTRRGPWSSPVE